MACDVKVATKAIPLPPAAGSSPLVSKLLNAALSSVLT